jgi:glycosyltransferase involved in cell wall biosynthesis
VSSIDIVVPCYRYGHFLRSCVESVLTQSGPTLRVLIIDDASPDNTAEIAEDLVRTDPRVNFRRHATNAGHIATYNEGIAWASADYMVLLSADDYLLPGALERSASLMDKYPFVGFTFGGAVALEHDREETEVLAPGLRLGTCVLPGLEFIKVSGAKNIVLTPSVMVRTSLQKKLGGYLPELTHSGDMEMWLRFAAHSAVGILDANQAVYRRHSANMSRGYSPVDDLSQRKAAFEHFLSSCHAVIPNVEDLRNWLMSQLAHDAIRCASRAFNEGDMELSARLAEFGLKLDPSAERSWPWWILTCKRRLGPRGWQFLQPAADRIRHILTLE